MRKNTLLIAGIITVIIGLGGVVFSASAAPGGWSGMMNDQWRENMRSARQNGDYNSWRSLVEEKHSRMLEWMTPDKFSRMSEMRKLVQEGKTDEANKIRKELGMPASPELQRGEPEWSGKFGGKNKSGGWRGNCWR